jgi:hypothetical protein
VVAVPQLVSTLLDRTSSMYGATMLAGSSLLTDTKKAWGFKSQARRAKRSMVALSKHVALANTTSPYL